PLTFQAERVTAADKHRLYETFQGKNPARLTPGETRTVHLTDRDVNQLIAWGMSFGAPERKARIEMAKGRATAAVSVGLATEEFERRFLNVTLGGEAMIEKGRIYFYGDRLSLGSIQAPVWLVDDLITPFATRVIRNDPRVKSAIAFIDK